MYYNFCVRYKILVGKAPPKSASLDEFKAFGTKAITAAKMEMGKLAQLGKTKVFLKSDAYHIIEQAREEAGLKHRLNLQTAARALIAQIKRRKLSWGHAAVIIQDDLRDYFRRSAVVREERRKAREALLAKQRKERDTFLEDFEEKTHALFSECDDRFGDLLAEMKRERVWLERKLAADAAARVSFEEEEYKTRLALWQTEFQGLMAFRPGYIALHLRSIEEVETNTRAFILPEEQQHWRGMFQVLEDMMLSGQRNDIERTERKVRRGWQKIEQLMYEELTDRLLMLPKYIQSVHVVCKQYGTKIMSIKEYSNKIGRRGANVQAARERAQAAEVFSKRHTTDIFRGAEDAKHCPGGGHEMSYMSSLSPKYSRVGDTIQTAATWTADIPWVGVAGVPDIDQLASGCRRTKTDTHAKPTAHAPQYIDTRTIGVNETFTDKFDEMQFLSQRHGIAAELKALSGLHMYDGPFTKIANIPDKATMRLAQDVLHSVIQVYSETLVKELRSLEAFCLQYSIPEQNRVTGEWIPYRKCAPELMQRYPQCTEWRALESESSRLHYAIDNFKSELLHIIENCIAKGARLVGDISERSNIHEVHAAYVKLQGSFLQCKRCLYPMASKDTLIALRITWPRVQCSKAQDRCRTCNTSAFQKPSIPQSTVGTLNLSLSLRDRRLRSMRDLKSSSKKMTGS
jgi:hypothetical protein